MNMQNEENPFAKILNYTEQAFDMAMHFIIEQEGLSRKADNPEDDSQSDK